jgi:hypothetical protein
VHEPVNGPSYWYIDSDNSLYLTSYENDWKDDKRRLHNKNVFLTEEEAKVYSKRRNLFNAIEKQITIINHENNWVVDWSDDDQEKWCLTYVHRDKVYFPEKASYMQKAGIYYMSKEAINFLLSDEVNDGQRKIWIEGV